MFRKLTLAGAAIAMGAATLIPAAPAMAQRYGDYDRYERGYYGDSGDRGYYRDDRRYRDRSYRGYDRRYDYSRRSRACKDGDGGTVIGAVAGGLAGNALAGRGDRTIGTILGGALGAVAGRAIDRSDPPRGCYRSR